MKFPRYVISYIDHFCNRRKVKELFGKQKKGLITSSQLRFWGLYAYRTLYSHQSFPFEQNIRLHMNDVLITWSKVLELAGVQQAKNYPALLWNPKFYYRVHRSPILEPILRHMNLSTSSHPNFSMQSLNLRFSYSNCECIPHPPMHATWSACFILLDLVTLSYLVNNINYEAAHYAIFSNLLLPHPS